MQVDLPSSCKRNSTYDQKYRLKHRLLKVEFISSFNPVCLPFLLGVNLGEFLLGDNVPSIRDFTQAHLFTSRVGIIC